MALRQWEFHDLLFHSRSRLGRHNYPYGGTFRFLNVLPPLPAVRPPGPARRVVLFKPDMRALEAGDVPFSRVTEARRSVRARGEQPLSASQLGEFLYRAARVKEVLPANREHGGSYEASIRPCASGGATHELDLYLTLSRCAAIEPGLYRYDPLAHELEHVTDLGPRLKRLLDDACLSSGLDTPPDVHITIAARFQRVAWKYQSMAYALILKNAGALYQQMYLVATAMNLAPCGLGGAIPICLPRPRGSTITPRRRLANSCCPAVVPTEVAAMWGIADVLRLVQPTFLHPRRECHGMWAPLKLPRFRGAIFVAENVREARLGRAPPHISDSAIA